MCEIFALNAREAIDTTPLLREFYRHAKTNPHGWGLSWRVRVPNERKSRLVVEREPRCALESTRLKNILSHHVCSNSVLAHIRYATRGELSVENTHPFTQTDLRGIQWSLIHNGTLFEDGPVRTYYLDCKGATDSEAMLPLLVRAYNSAHATADMDLLHARFNALESAIELLAQNNKLNIAIDDGTFMFVHTNCTPQRLFMAQGPHLSVFCTRPLNNVAPFEGNAWRSIPRCRLLVFHYGELIWQGKEHGHIFVDTPVQRAAHDTASSTAA